MARAALGRTAASGWGLGLQSLLLLLLLLLLGLGLPLQAAPVTTGSWAQTPGSSPGSCPPSSFQCRTSGYCVPLTWRCDGDQDCSDGSDERECRIELCAQKGQCPPPAGHPCPCDNISACQGSGHHENLLNCSRAPCPPGEIRCPLGDACIPHRWRCDGHPDCPNASDELGCETGNTLQDRNGSTTGAPVTPATVPSLRNVTATSVGSQAGNPSAYGLVAIAVVLGTGLAAAALFTLSRLRAQGRLPPAGLLVAVKEGLLLSRPKNLLL
ncbi:CD320 antigen [Ochotona princeps]|uniref:CD320 antigen n=1 Tax=Ochotona princeps TaxID=9978 RepID=UPI0027148313|nr:CD320 antigen [Ochotona princeps]